jgi:DNA-binding transcriptional ArsR family regulator
MLTYVPVPFAVYRPLKPHLRWTLQNLVGFADTEGRCWPSVRTLAEVTGNSKSSISRHLRELERAGALSRERRPGGVYRYQIAARFLPASRVSHARKAAVPRARTEEQITKNRSDSLDFLGDSPWKQRLASWQKSRFWLPQWGPKPGETGCFAPLG